MDMPHQSPDMPSTPINSGDKPRLSEKKKKENHIASEHKRRNAIRDGFDQLASLTPGMEGQGRSEAVLLGRFNEEMRRQLATLWRNVQMLKAKGHDTKDWEFDPDTMRQAEDFAREEDQQFAGQRM